MANDLNQCNFIGRLGDDPDVHYLPTGSAVVNFSIAVGSKWKDKNSGETKESTEWVRLVAFGKTAEIVGEYLRKGSQVFVTSSCRTRKWQDQNGADRYTTEFVVDNMQMLGSRQQSSNGQANQAAPQAQAPAYQPKPQQNQGTQNAYAPKSDHGAPVNQRHAPQQRPAPTPQQNFTPDLDDGWDDGIPF